MEGLGARGELGGYRVEREIGRGGMGIVYLARQVRPERLVALKVIAPELAGDERFRRRFEREANLAARIEHPNVIPIYEVGEAGGQIFIAMRYVEGTDLGSALASRGALSPVEATRVIDQVAEALDAAHAFGLVHRDVKPGNVLLAGGPGGHAYLTDFGLARLTTSESALTGTGLLVGTLDYMAPEQVQGGPVDARTDVYALGCVLFHCLAGRVPYERETDLAKIYAHVHEPPPPLPPSAGPRLEAVVARAMEKDPGRRHPSAGDLGREAVAAAEGRISPAPERSVATGAAAPAAATAPGAAATASSHPAAAGRRRPSRRLIAAIAGAAVLAAAGGLAVAVMRGGGSGSGGGGPPRSALPCSNEAAASAFAGPGAAARFEDLLGVEGLRVNAKADADDPSAYTLTSASCQDLDGDGADELVAQIGCCTGSSTRPWGIFANRDGRWTLEYARAVGPAPISLQGTEVVEKHPTYRPGDPLCCPTSTRFGRVAWDGERYLYRADEGPSSRLIALEGTDLESIAGLRLALPSEEDPDGVTFEEATQHFGTPTYLYADDLTCDATWGDVGLRMDFTYFGGGEPCRFKPGSGTLQRIELVGPAAEQAGWRLENGLRVGMDEAAVTDLYPDARRFHSTDPEAAKLRRKEAGSPLPDPLVLVEGPSPLTVSYPVLEAQPRDGAITAIALNFPPRD